MNLHFDSLALPVPPGYRVGPWEVREPLASGAFATVYAGRRAEAATAAGTHGLPGPPAEVTLKFLPAGTRTPRQLDHLREISAREPEVLRRIRRPRLIRMHQTLTVDDPAEPLIDGATVVVLERAESSLESLLRHCPRPAAGPALLAQICEGLHQLHHSGWAHGALKPGNVLLMPDQSVRLGDFHQASEPHGAHGYAPAFQTTDWSAPELLWDRAGEPDGHLRAAADIWAFGVLAHLVLTGSLPLPGATPGARRDAAVRYARGEEELSLSAELPKEWREIVTVCLAPGQEERAALDTGELLRRVETAAGVPASPRLPRRFMGRRPVGRRPARRRRRRSDAGLRSPVGWSSTVAAVVACTLMLIVLRDTPTAEAAGYDRCAVGHVCFFSEEDGEGEMCAWYDDERDWHSEFSVCDWGRDSPPRSVLNNGYVDDLPGAHYFEKKDFKEPVGCLQPLERRNLKGEVLIRSVKWLPSC
ncbi:serine/threonine protein kinase [Streptomyces inusitatus]|uniref:Serine/threonine protein kinase n=1 Tax=Streptomyces inusitatus TaxID=68221 RepID=A0A918PRC2_9ACTN|nr:protein kinase [Streptomyces inusitatus]GGZ19203.1 serine/threonine protein kinase [Streptomyces inusitatus]